MTEINPRLATFIAGSKGPWRIVRMDAPIGEPLPAAARMDVIAGTARADDAVWALRGVTSNERYVNRSEKRQAGAIQQGLGRPAATRAALIPIRKRDAWWELPQDERRRIFEQRSRHVRIGLEYLPAVARRLHHCRDLGTQEPFDFLTWFEFAPADEPAFDQLVARLRATEEWDYVEREVDMRLVRDARG